MTPRMTRKQRSHRAAELNMEALRDWRAGKIGDAELQWRIWDTCKLLRIPLMQPAPAVPRPLHMKRLESAVEELTAQAAGASSR